MQAYSDPKRAADPHTLPNLEIWEDEVRECEHCGYILPGQDVEATAEEPCPGCQESGGWVVPAEWPITRESWWYQFCFPGCLPDGDPVGPFATQEAALADAQADAMDDDEESEE